MSTMTIERRKKIENHIVKSYFTKCDGIRHGSNGWDIVHGTSDRDVPTVFAEPAWGNDRVVVHWFIPGEVNYIDPARTKVTAYYELVVVPGWFDTSDNKLELDKANDKIEELDRCLNQANDIIDEWKKATERDTPEEAEKRIDGILDDLARDDDRIIDLGVEIKKLQDRLKANKYNKLWITSNGLLFSESDKTVDVLEAQIEEASKVISDWQNATECKLPSQAKERIDHYKRRLGNAVQAASCAAKHLENITF